MNFSRGQWRLVADGSHSGAENMARDEAIALCAGQGLTEATLRAYRFKPPAVTIGRFQNFPGGIDLDACALEHISVVRRPTGGLAILHMEDFTYSVVVPTTGTGPGARDQYFDLVAGAIIEALAVLGIGARQVRHNAGRLRGAWCFEGVFGIDLEYDGRKICGSAQRMFPGAVLQHGSLFLTDSGGMLDRLTVASASDNAAGANFITLGEAAPGRVIWEEVLDAFVNGFERSLDVVLKPGTLTPGEESLAKRLVVEKYTDEAWLRHPRRNEPPPVL